MKVLLVNGSSHKNGCTYTALNEAAVKSVIAADVRAVARLVNVFLRTEL